MNRLWVRLSLAIGLAVILVALFPHLWRIITPPPEPPFRPAMAEGLSDQQFSELRLMIRERENRIWINLSWALLAGAAIGLLVGVLLSRGLVAPLRRLEQAARAISEGDLAHRVPLQGSQEFRAVGHSFNQMAQELQRAESLRKNLLADVAHELRHPIHIVQGNLQAILDGVYPLEMQEIAGLVDETQQLAALVNDLHELAQTEAHQLPLFKQELDLVELTAKTVEAFQPLAAAQEIQLSLEIPPQAILVAVDADRMRQVLKNLLNNALQHTPAGGSVNVSLQRAGTGVEICIQDSGSGIEPEHLGHVFDRFYRADPSRSRQSGGAGLGLAIARAIIQAHGGEIEAQSEGKGRGSVFVVRL